MEFLFEDSMLVLAGGFFVAAAGLGCLYLLIGAIVILWHGRGREAEAVVAPQPVTILKPLYGDEPGLFDRLKSFCTQDYGAPVQVVFGVQDHDDPAIETVRRLQAALPDAMIDLKIDERAHGSNRKISNVVNMVTLARHSIIVLSDSDIEVGPHYLRAVIGELQRPGVGLVTCLYHGTAEGTAWSQLERIGVDTHFLPNAVTAIRLGLADPCFGSTMALRLETLNRIGGFQAFADCLADDHAIGDAIRAGGQRIAMPSFSVGHACRQRTLADVVLDDLRCARTIRNIDPVGHLGSVITHPLPLALIGLALGSMDGLLMALIALTCRAALCRCVERVFGLSRHSYWLIPVRDILAFLVYLASFFGSGVNWRGYRYRVLSNGRLIQESPTVQS
ncbi:MAG TPA: bacteriohopanetetrol glucosamine biosynthesis glycosyltransferase HpnI [Pseudorhodoplanes sp.]|nr:bacteriohopanetetrol glucosamine biosynthesis glycosyltransferase HpnI [Pseudorhodoplanes sp.]